MNQISEKLSASSVLVSTFGKNRIQSMFSPTEEERFEKTHLSNIVCAQSDFRVPNFVSFYQEKG